MTNGEASRRPVVFGTAGHIDHGKSALVEALTGEPMDRLPEEKRRGISIDLGFAPLNLDPGAPAASFVDVPGHEAFVKNMVAGASGIDAALLVVAADEGVMPQTTEHVIVLDALGVSEGVIAITKSDLVEADWIPVVADTVAEALAGTSLAGATIVTTSAHTGEGLDRLRTELSHVARRIAVLPDSGALRLPIDRVFSVVGVGTVVTGTLRGGSISRGSLLEVLPGGGTVRVRTIEVHGSPVDVVEAGSRAALALSGPGTDDVSRGATLVEAGSPLRAQTAIDSCVWLSPRAPRPVRSGDRLRFHHGTREGMGRVRWYDRDALDPGAESIGRVVLETPIVAAVGDRLVVRAYSPVTTIGGGTILALDPRRLRGARAAERGAMLTAFRKASGSGRLVRVLEMAGATGVEISRLSVETGLGAARVEEALEADGVIRLGQRAFARPLLEDAARRVVAAVARHQARNPLREGMPLELARAAIGRGDPAFVERALETAISAGAIERRGAAIAVSGDEIDPGSENRALVGQVAEAYRETGLEAPDAAALASRFDIDEQRLREVQHYLERQGDLVRLASDWYADAETVAAAREAIVDRIREEGSLNTGGCKEILGVSRKYLIPILEYFDATGATRRDGNRRTLGPQP